MGLNASNLWRVFFVVGSLVYFQGSGLHPRGNMAEMLADPAWVPAHATVLVGWIILTAGFFLLRRSEPAASSLGRWLPLAIVATALEAVEMGVHTIANVDLEALNSGQATPVLTTHVWLATLIYPFFGFVLFGLILAGQRTKSLGSVWFGWLGMIGAVAHGIVMVLVHFLDVSAAALLFPVSSIAFALWFILAGVWPVRKSVVSA